MFTGLIQCLGDVRSVNKTGGTGGEARISIRPRTPLHRPAVGESIAVNGVCLTAESFDNGAFTAYASQETLACSTLGALAGGQVVNIEQALAFGDRLGGHLVSGHSDCVATVTELALRGASFFYGVSFPPAFSVQVLPKGSVALDGVSLTVNACGEGFLEVNIIPETQKATTIALWKKGTRINMETDIIGKYVARLLGAGVTPAAAHGGSAGGSALTVEQLRDMGF